MVGTLSDWGQSTGQAVAQIGLTEEELVALIQDATGDKESAQVKAATYIKAYSKREGFKIAED